MSEKLDVMVDYWTKEAEQDLSWSLPSLVAWPLVFLKEKHARLEVGTVFGAITQSDTIVKIERSGPEVSSIRVRQILEAEIVDEELKVGQNTNRLPVRLTYCGGELREADILTVNDQPIRPTIPVALIGTSGFDESDCS